MEYFRLLFDHLAWIEHQFSCSISDSRKSRRLWGMKRGVGGVRRSIHQSLWAKGLGLGLLCWGFKGVYIPILVLAYLTKMGINIVPHPAYNPDLAPCDFWLFPKLRGCHYETIQEMKEPLTTVIDALTQEDLGGALPKLQTGGDYFEGDYSFMCVLSIKVSIRKKSGNLFNDPRMYIHLLQGR